ncbi:MAG TPA: Gfo/Idh/MocA family oxidoreductase [Candidatus Sulfopaludibacter sp.]|jgi:predicted dehydrogenase|nr:Gfo/Idh/MocA family oxidoreductase [Candidatus Sulfopaludibacter sp.]
MTRRELARIAGIGLASRLLGQEQGRQIGYCMVGLGRISMQHFMPALKTTKYSKLTAVVSGHRDKAEKMAAQYGLPDKNIYSYDNYDSIAGNKEIDAVYIALPNSMHAEYTIRAAKAGKHVLCEKPMSTSVADAEAMIAACKTANKKLMIAYRCQLEPVNLHAIQLIRDGKLGKVQAIESANGFNIARNEWRYTRKLGGGGPLMDMGIYSLNACRYLTGEEPSEIRAEASVIDHDGRFDEVEENLSFTLKFPSGVVASCNTSYGCNMPGFYRVHASRGGISMEAAFGYQGQHLTAQMQGQPPVDDTAQDRDPSHFVRQADHFSECILQDKTPVAPGEEGLRDMRLMDQIYKACGLKLG